MSSHDGISIGHTWSLVCASIAKHALQSKNMPPEMRLQFLEHLEKMTDATLTPAVIAIVEPMDPKGLELWHEATKLGYGPRSPNVFDALYKKFAIFAECNSSLKAAYDEACRPWGGSYDSIYSKAS